MSRRKLSAFVSALCVVMFFCALIAGLYIAGNLSYGLAIEQRPELFAFNTLGSTLNIKLFGSDISFNILPLQLLDAKIRGGVGVPRLMTVTQTVFTKLWGVFKSYLL